MSEIQPYAHPDGILPAADIFFPHPDKTGKNALGKYLGQRDGKSVISWNGSHRELDHHHVKRARGIPRPANARLDMLRMNFQMADAADRELRLGAPRVVPAIRVADAADLTLVCSKRGAALA